jgi:glycosyltransferase involved in cell wall biosynthesis
MPHIADTSVVIPARNAAATLGPCLDAIARLNPSPLEVIVVNDASTDTTAQIAAEKGARVVHLDRNLGPGLARNAGVKVARGEYVAFTDSDCQVPSDWLGRFHEAFDAVHHAGITGPYAGSTAKTILCSLMDAALKHEQRAMPDVIESSITSNLFVRAADFRGCGGFPAYQLPDASMPAFGNEDEELAYLLVKHVHKPLKWLRDNGVYHAFRPTWRAYFKQQAKYAEAILISNIRFPGLLVGTTNYSRGGGLRKLAVFWLFAGSCAGSVVLGRPSLLAGCVPFLSMHFEAVRSCVAAEPALGRKLRLAAAAYPFHALTALAWTKGLAVGARKGVSGALSRAFWARQEGELT